MKYRPQILMYLYHKIFLPKIYFTKAEIRKWQLHHQCMVLKMEILLICFAHLLENKQLHKLLLNPLMEIHWICIFPFDVYRISGKENRGPYGSSIFSSSSWISTNILNISFSCCNSSLTAVPFWKENIRSSISLGKEHYIFFASFFWCKW